MFSIKDLWALKDLGYSRQAVWTHVMLSYVFLHLKTSPNLHQMLQCCFEVKLQKISSSRKTDIQDFRVERQTLVDND